MYSFEEKIKQQVIKTGNPHICFFDIDGTIFTPDIRIVKAPFYDCQTFSLLKKNSIPFIVITGRFTWNFLRDIEMKMYGLPQPDGIVFAGGSRILLKKPNGRYEEDKKWSHDQSSLHEPLMIDGIPPFHTIQKNVYVTDVRNVPIHKLQEVMHQLTVYYKETASLFYSESLVKKNSVDIFSGSIYITPLNKTKEGAVKHILDYSQKYRKDKKLHVSLFGDGSIDIPMLSIPSDEKRDIHGYLVHPTPLAKKSAEKHTHITILNEEGPQAILHTLQKNMHPSSQFSPAQNNPLRKIIQLCDPLLDRLTDSSLSANDISLLGIRQVVESEKYIHRYNPFLKIFGVYLYIFGNLTDVLDGIRARRKGKTLDGQLVDGFADRAKEFFQLYNRGKKLLIKDHEKALHTFLASISCALPSIARAQAEIQNVIVKERDNKGGSMIDRTKLLFASMFFEVLPMASKSYIIDTKIRQNNLATFTSRLAAAPDFSLGYLKKETFNSFQKLAVERWLLYIEIFQDENTLIEKTLTPYPSLQKEFLEKTKKYSFFTNLPISTIRKENNIQPFSFHLHDII